MAINMHSQSDNVGAASIFTLNFFYKFYRGNRLVCSKSKTFQIREALWPCKKNKMQESWDCCPLMEMQCDKVPRIYTSLIEYTSIIRTSNLRTFYA